MQYRYYKQQPEDLTRRIKDAEEQHSAILTDQMVARALGDDEKILIADEKLQEVSKVLGALYQIADEQL